jgi:hypothetical protein
LTADNTFSLYVNGKYIGAPPNEANSVVESTAWGRAQQFNVGLNGVKNVFTVFVTNFLNPTSGTTSPAGLVASIRIRYTDGSSDVVRPEPTQAGLMDPTPASTPSFLHPTRRLHPLLTSLLLELGHGASYLASPMC